jgi:Mg-chelatase subunit ChlD
MRRYLLYILPVAFLFLFLFQVPFYVPSILLGRTVFVDYAGGSNPESLFRHLQKHRVLYLLNNGEAIRLRKRDFPEKENVSALLEQLPRDEITVLNRYIPAVVAATPTLSKVTIILGSRPESREIAALAQLQHKLALPVEVQLEKQAYDPLFMAYSYTHGSQESSLIFDLLFSDRVQDYKTIRIYRNGSLLETITPSQLSESRHYRTSLPIQPDILLDFELVKPGTTARRSIRISSREEEDPQLLMISNRTGSTSFLENLYTLKKIALPEALQEDLFQYPLIVFDGIPIKSIGPELTAILSDIYRRRTSSILFIADSPGFGTRGDNPGIEKILPTELSPRSLRYLPDMAILIVLDISASMMGEKLSLAKVSTLELIKNLKDSDRISILTFWDQYRFLHGFEEKRNLNTEVQLAPLVAKGGTDLYQALTEGQTRLAEERTVQRHIIILTDGKTEEGEFASLFEQALLEDITMSTLAVGEDINKALLTSIAQKTGGNYYRVVSLEEIPSLIFEDRREIARTSFGEDLFPVYDFTDTQIAQIFGMSLFAPKPERIVLYRNQYEDPLLLMENRERQLIMMFLSDMYGHYTRDFLANPSVVRTFQRTLDSILETNKYRIRIGESFRNISVTVHGEGLVEPVLAIYSENQLVFQRKLQRGSFLTHSTGLTLARPGSYTAILYDRGVPFLRFPLYFNGIMEGQSTESHFALQRLQPRSFRAISSTWLYLVLFFISSVAVTFLSRRRSSPRSKN